jgi:hypothetical protein
MTTRRATPQWLSECFWLKNKSQFFHILPTALTSTPCDFFMFPKIKKNLKGHHFGTLTNVQTAATQALNTLTVEDIQGC